jgi:3-phenylpropionate/trans-cinnamate dioxygenase ferredoxin reductase subunit
MSALQMIVIVGASLAGAKAAETLRVEGFDGRVLLVGDEPVRPYERPPLSKVYLRGEAGFDVAAVHEAGFYEKHRIELRTSTTVTRVDPGRSEVELASGERLRYDRLLLATGAAPRRLAVPGSDLGRVLYLRNLGDADTIRAAITASDPIVVIGAGWIGAEVAASARQLGADVTMVDPVSVPLERVLGPDVGRIFRDLHAEHGVRMHFGAGVTPQPPGWRLRTVSSRTSASPPVHPGFTRQGTWPTPGTQRTAGTSVSSTGRLPSIRDPQPPGTCSESRPPTPKRPTFSPINLTWAWNTGAGRLTSTRSSSAAIRLGERSWRSGCTAGRWPQP